MIEEMGAAAKATSKRVDPWSRGRAKDRFSGPNSMNPQAYQIERAKSPAPKPVANPLRAEPRTPNSRAASVPKRRPSPKPKAVEGSFGGHNAPKTPQPTSIVPVLRSSPEENRQSTEPLSAKGPGSGRGSSSAFASASKGRFDAGPGSFYVAAERAPPGVGTFNPNDGPDSFGAGGKSPGSMAKPSPGMAPTNKGRFSPGPGSIYAPAEKKPSKKRNASPSAAAAAQDAAAEEWSKKLGLGAIAGAKAAPVLKAVDEAREKAEALAAQAIAEKEAAEAQAAEAMRKAEWMSNRAQERVVEAEQRCEAAEEEAAEARRAHEELRDALEEAHAEIERVHAEADKLRSQVAKLPQRKLSPKNNKVIDRRPVRLRGSIDADAEDMAARAEARRTKREEHWKAVEAERIAKEDRIREQQLAKSKEALSGRRPKSSDRKSGPPPPPDALKAFALVLPTQERAGGSRSDNDVAAASRRSSVSDHPLGGITPKSSGRQLEMQPLESAVDVSESTDADHMEHTPEESASEPPPPPPSLFTYGAGTRAADAIAADEDMEMDIAALEAASDGESAVDIGAWGATQEADGSEGRPTGVCSLANSPLNSIASAEGKEEGSPVDLCLSGQAGVPAPEPFFENSSFEFAAAEAEAEKMVQEEARMASAKAASPAKNSLKGGEHVPSLDAMLGSMRESAEWAAAKSGVLSQPDDETDDIIDESGGAHAAAAAAIKAVLGEPPSSVGKEHLFGRSGTSLTRESSFSGMRLSESMGALPSDDFLSRLAKAEEAPASPGGMKARIPSSALFSRGVGASGVRLLE